MTDSGSGIEKLGRCVQKRLYQTMLYIFLDCPTSLTRLEIHLFVNGA